MEILTGAVAGLGGIALIVVAVIILALLVLLLVCPLRFSITAS